MIEDGCITKLVEFKCPVKCKDLPIIDRQNEVSNVKYLSFVRGDVQLNKNHPYFSQVPVQLYVTGMFTCDLFIYSQVNDGCCTVPIHRNGEFQNKVILSAENISILITICRLCTLILPKKIMKVPKPPFNFIVNENLLE